VLTPILLMALAASIVLNVYQLAHVVVLSRCQSWGLRSQGAWHWRLPVASLLANVWAVGLVHLDIDHLKKLNSTLGEKRANELLRQALRSNDVYRLQSGDELVAIVRAGQAQAVADRLAARLAALPLQPAELAALGGPITATTVVIERTNYLRAALSLAVSKRESLKAAGERGGVVALNGGQQ
jgi:hypothetical protein